jgi:hypothetical protein
MRCRFRRQIGADYTDFSGVTRKGQKRIESPSVDHDFKPIPNDVRPGREGVVRLHEVAGGQRPSNLAHPRGDDAGKQRFTAAAAGDLRSKGRERCGSRPGPTPACAPSLTIRNRSTG